MSTAFIIAGASSAHAASSDDFARLRQCESGGNYSINTGNGFYGAYQFDLQTWHGLGYPGLPSDAPKATQDAAARALQASRGWQPWPSCSRQLGLRRSSGSTKSTAATDSTPADTSPTQSGASSFGDSSAAAQESAAAFEVLPVGTVAVPPPPPVQPFAIDVSGTPREDVRMWQEQMAKRGWDIVVDGFHGEESARVAAAFIEAKSLVQTPGHTMTELLWNASWEIPVT